MPGSMRTCFLVKGERLCIQNTFEADRYSAQNLLGSWYLESFIEMLTHL